jgi:hypothetical protein
MSAGGITPAAIARLLPSAAAPATLAARPAQKLAYRRRSATEDRRDIVGFEAESLKELSPWAHLLAFSLGRPAQSQAHRDDGEALTLSGPASEARS